MSDNGVQPGYVYLLGNEANPFIWKVGFSKNMADRLYDLSRPTGVFSSFYVIRKVFVPDMKKFEDRLHAQFAAWRVSKKEGFGVLVKNSLDMNEITQAIDKFSVFKQVALGSFDTLIDAFPDQPTEPDVQVPEPAPVHDTVVQAVHVHAVALPMARGQVTAPRKYNKPKYSTNPSAVEKRLRYQNDPEARKKQADANAKCKAKKLATQRQAIVTN
jgi:hypothetical protein